MTKTLSKLIEEASKLPDDVQESMAAQWFEELRDEVEWSKRFSDSQSELGKLAERARSQVKEGKYRDAGFDEL